MAEKYADLQRLSRDELVAAHDNQITNMAGGASWYLDELAPRDAREQGDRMEAMTQTIVRLTKWIAGCTVVSTAAVIVALALG